MEKWRKKKMENEKTKKIMLIGLGPHSKRIYYPLIEKYASKMNFELTIVVDLENKKEDILKYLQDKKLKPELIFIKPKQQTYDKLNPDLEKQLNEVIKKKQIEGVIIATEPLVHVMYAKWALKNNLFILMDKPVSTYKNISTDMRLAKQLITDFDDLADLYKKARIKNPNLTFSLMAQRRFHPAFQKIRGLIKDCFDKTKCPITSIQTFHCDGQWRMPTEIVQQLYHPYMQGYGKCSHSGYHFFDIIPFLLEAGLDENKYYDNIDVFTNFVRPLDFMEQFTLEDYERMFGKKIFQENNCYNQEQLNCLMKGFGEVDAFSNIAFKKGNKVMTVCSLNLAHNGFARRHWVTAKGKDLYKGNGRVRHESHILEQGPFQSIHYHSYQSKEVNPKLKTDLYEVGGEYHLDIYVFRNTKMIGGKAVEKFTIKDLNINIMEGKSRGHQEDARAKGFLEFIESLQGLRPQYQMTSDFMSHRAAATITSGIYQSAVAQLNNSNPKINLPFWLGEIEEIEQKLSSTEELNSCNNLVEV